MNILINWIKQPANIVFIILLIGVTIYGVIDDNLDVIIKVYLGIFLFGSLLRGVFYIKNKF